METPTVWPFVERSEEMNKEEAMIFLEGLNAQFPEEIKFSPDGIYDRYLIVSAKNYATKSDNKIVIKGASLKSNSRELALREFLERVLVAIMNDESHLVASIHAEYESEIENIKDPRRWAARKTITESVLYSNGTTQRKIRKAIQGLGLGLGDKVWVLFRPDGSLIAMDNWKGDHCKKRLKAKLKKTFEILEGVFK